MAVNIVHEFKRERPPAPFAIGDHVSKAVGMKYVGTVLACYWVDHVAEWWVVVLLDKNDASDYLQHLYPARLFELA